MADQPTGGSVATTAAVAVPTGAALIVLQYLVHPVWPPPDAVLTIAATALVPVAHMMGKAIMNRFTRIASQIDPTDDAPAVVQPPPPPPPQALVTPAGQPIAPQQPPGAPA